MNDPWDVKSVRQGNQYQSCMKINGVPLLPPVLSKECRKEMQYYKLLAKEVEKRICTLKTYVNTDTDDDTLEDADLMEHEDLGYVLPLEEKNGDTLKFINDTPAKLNEYTVNKDECQTVLQDTQIVEDINLENNKEVEIYSIAHSPCNSPESDEVPERDCDYKNNTQVELKTKSYIAPTNVVGDNTNLDNLSDKDDYSTKAFDGLSLSSKSFTGSLHDIHADSSKESQKPMLIRQSSYTVLVPSPQLLAHLQVEAISTGVDLNSISMSESITKLDDSSKKRKSWDLESAKVKWSSMALELKTNNIVNKTNTAKKTIKSSPTNRSRSVIRDRHNLNDSVNDKTPRSEPIQKSKSLQNPALNSLAAKRKETHSISPTRNRNHSKTAATDLDEQNLIKTIPLVSESEDPAARVRELYEKLQKQQMVQLANLMEKQKREQYLLQQVFEEQNTILLKQLKSVCPKASFEIKHAWGDLKDDSERGPVSLSQLINTSTPNNSSPNSPVTKTLTESSSCISKCENVLKKSRDITKNIKNPVHGSRISNGYSNQKGEPANKSQPHEKRVIKRRSPVKNTSRKLNYDSSATSDFEPLISDRTNDTMADLNVTFPSDISESLSYRPISNETKTKASSNRACSPMRKFSNASQIIDPAGITDQQRATEDAIKDLEDIIKNPTDIRTMRPGVNIRQPNHERPTEGAIKDLEDTIQNSKATRIVKPGAHIRQPTARERVAATKIVACAKGYLVRRLMRTERVQGTVQTIRDALLCALQLHQDREGIRGADVDLHRRLIQQITAACYQLHDIFVTSDATERCALIASDRARKQALATRLSTPKSSRRENIMSQSHSGAYPSRAKRPSSTNPMTQSNYETFSEAVTRPRLARCPRRVPWR